MAKDLFANLSGTKEAEAPKDDLNKQTPDAAETAGEQEESVEAADYSNEDGADETPKKGVSVLDAPEEEVQMPSQLDMLKQRADLMRISYPVDADVEFLKKAISDKLTAAENDTKGPAATNAAITPAAPAGPQSAGAVETVTPVVVKKSPAISLRQAVLQENMRLIRIRITNLDPKDKDLPGQFFTVANDFIGNVVKYVPFDDASENGYHVPYCIFKQMKAQKFQQIRVTKKNGREHVETSWVRKFAIEELEPLTPAEIERLAAAQLGAGSIDKE